MTSLDLRRSQTPAGFFWTDGLPTAPRQPCRSPADRKRLWFVAYDISDPRRLKHVATLCEAHGLRIQYSLFAVLATIQEARALCGELQARIKPGEDDVRLYAIAADAPILHCGRPLQPADLIPLHPSMFQLRLALGA